MPFLMIRNDITKVQADAVVNPANERLLQGSGTSRAVYLAAGEELLTEACRKIGHCALGTAVMTEAFNLPARYIIHAAGPQWRGGNCGEEELLYHTYIEAMKLAKKHHLESIAFPLLSAGSYGYPKEEAFQTAVRAIQDFLETQEMMVYLVLYDSSAAAVGKKLSASLEEYIDDHYIDTHDECYCSMRDAGGVSGFDRRNARYDIERPESSGMLCEDYLRYPQTSSAPKPAEQKKAHTLFSKKRTRSLEQLMSHTSETFSQMLLRLIDERGLKDSAAYKKANVDRRHFSKIRNDINYMPNKKTVLAFAVALELSLDETKDLLMRAGFALSDCVKSDVIICYFIENHQYDIFEINEALFFYGQPLLGE